MNMLVTGSWDKTLKYWDLRSPTPAASVQMAERVVSMDVKYPLMVVATLVGVLAGLIGIPGGESVPLQAVLYDRVH